MTSSSDIDIAAAARFAAGVGFASVAGSVMVASGLMRGGTWQQARCRRGGVAAGTRGRFGEEVDVAAGAMAEGACEEVTPT